MNRREFRKRKIEVDEKLIEMRRRECIAYERKIEYDMATRQKDAIEDTIKLTLKLVKMEIKGLLENKDKKEE